MGFTMKVTDFCKSYFNGFHDILNYKKNDAKTNVLAAVKIFSYFTVVIPFGFVVVYGAAFLYGRVSKKEVLSSHDKSVNDKAKIILLKKDSPTKDMPPTIEPSNHQSVQLKEYSYPEEANLESATTTSKTEKLKEPDSEMEKVTKKEQDVKERTEFAINLPPQQLIVSMSAIEISWIATALIGDVMDRLWIDIEVTNEPMYIVDPGPGNSLTYAMAKKYNKESPLMRFLLPICTDIITKSFANPSEFTEKGIVFDFLNSNKTGLLDQIKDDTLKGRIVSGMRSRSTLSMTLNAKAGKTPMLEIKQYMDGASISRQTSTVKHLLESAEAGLL